MLSTVLSQMTANMGVAYVASCVSELSTVGDCELSHVRIWVAMIACRSVFGSDREFLTVCYSV